jgi:DNA-binding IscR family transcriptional regulator
MSEKWGFLTNHALVLVYVILHPDSTVRQISQALGITERSTLAILRDMEIDNVVVRAREGRRNTYTVNFRQLGTGRRGGASSPLTPRPFAEAVLRTLYTIAVDAGTVPVIAPPPTPVPPDELKPRIGAWGFFTNHLLVVLQMARGEAPTIRAIAQSVRITERAAATIVAQLEAEGIVAVEREGRRNIYRIDISAFANFRRWSFGTWRLPQPVIDLCVNGLRALMQERADAGSARSR